MVLALIALSLVPLTGWAGQVNFAPLAFAGFGAFVFLRLGLWFGVDDTAGTGNLTWLPVIGLFCAPRSGRWWRSSRRDSAASTSPCSRWPSR